MIIIHTTTLICIDQYKNQCPISLCRGPETIANHLPCVFILYGALYDPLGIIGQPTGLLVQQAGRYTSSGGLVYQYLRRHLLLIPECPGSGRYSQSLNSLFCDIENRGLKPSQSVVNSAFFIGNKSPASSKYFWTPVEAAPGWARPPETPKALDPRFQFRGSLIKAKPQSGLH